MTICICAYGRPKMLNVCLESLHKSKLSTRLLILDDGSSYDVEVLEKYGAEVIVREPHRNHGSWSVATGRIELMEKALESDTCELIYHTDADVLHDPDWLERLWEMSNLIDKHADYQVFSLFNSSVQAVRGMHMQTLSEGMFRVVRRVEAPGCSYAIRGSGLRALGAPYGINQPGVGKYGAWDHLISQGLAEYRCLISEESFVDHYREGGIHEQFGDEALNLTGFLACQREGVEAYLKES